MIDNMMEFGYTPSNLKKLRHRYGITQQQLADLLNTTISTVQRWETSSERKSHATMPHIKWVELFKILNKSGRLYE